jgi:transcriptional regulator GlxA family with amidase domain
VHTGTLVLAKAGLLNGRKATTHWKWCDELRNAYPAVSVEHNVIYVRHGNFYTSAGATAGIDLALALVEEDLGAALASKIAQMLLVFSRRSGRQPQVSVTLAAQSNKSQPLGELLSWLPDNLQEDLSVAKLARRAAMSPRNFARSFRANLGTTPAKHIERLRLELAKRHLEATTHGLAGVAGACGFANSETLRRAFLRHCGLTPGQFRASLKFSNPAGNTLRAYRPARQPEELLVAASSHLHAQALAQPA